MEWEFVSSNHCSEDGTLIGLVFVDIHKDKPRCEMIIEMKLNRSSQLHHLGGLALEYPFPEEFQTGRLNSHDSFCGLHPLVFLSISTHSFTFLLFLPSSCFLLDFSTHLGIVLLFTCVV